MGRQEPTSVGLYSAQHRTPAFEHFFYQAIKDHILAHGRIDAEEAAWLRRMLFADGKIEDEERKFLHELKGEAKQVSREFEVLFEESMKQPQEQHTQVVVRGQKETAYSSTEYRKSRNSRRGQSGFLFCTAQRSGSSR